MDILVNNKTVTIMNTQRVRYDTICSFSNFDEATRPRVSYAISNGIVTGYLTHGESIPLMDDMHFTVVPN